MAKMKLMMSWDMLPGNEEEYFEFHIQKFIPTLELLGVSLHEAWLTVYADSDQPRLMAEGVVPSYAAAQRALSSAEWIDLSSQIEEMVDNFDYKVIPFRTRWQF